MEKYNNGPEDVWPIIPDTKAEKEQLLEGEVVSRPDAPSPKTTNFKAEVTSVKSFINGDQTEVDKGEFGFGLNVAEKGETLWNEDGTEVTLSIANGDLTTNSTIGQSYHLPPKGYGWKSNLWTYREDLNFLIFRPV